jgi:predicted glycosyltransferase
VALGTPVYTTYGGRLGGVDEELMRQGRMQPLIDPAALVVRHRATGADRRIRRDPGALAAMMLSAVA